MSQTQRCIICTEQGIEKPLWEDEVCESCGRCEEHCTAPHTLLFDPQAKMDDGRPHPDAGRKVTKQFDAKEDPDRAGAPL